MLVLRNIITAGCAILVSLALVIFTRGTWPTAIIGAALALVASFLATFYVTMGEESRFDRFMLGVPALFVVVGALSLVLFIGSPLVRGVIIIAAALIQAAYLTHLFFFLHVTNRYTPRSLESLANLIYLFLVFSIATAMFGTVLFTEIPEFALFLPYVAMIAVAAFQSLWVGKVSIERARRLAIVSAVMQVEMAIALSFLPTSLYVNGAVLAIFAYVTTYLFEVAPSDPHFMKTARRAFFLASTLAVILLATSPWK